VLSPTAAESSAAKIAQVHVRFHGALCDVAAVGELASCEYLMVESECAAMSAAIGASGASRQALRLSRGALRAGPDARATRPGQAEMNDERNGGVMAVRCAINGFGRTGRAAFRAAYERGLDIEWVAVNDVAEPALLAHLLKFDTVYGPFSGTVEVADGRSSSTASGSRHRPRPTPQCCRGTISASRS
jgi:hypothetical protein